jgi:hypothetical protein
MIWINRIILDIIFPKRRSGFDWIVSPIPCALAVAHEKVGTEISPLVMFGMSVDK